MEITHKEINDIVLKGIQIFIKAHPETLKPDLVGSLAKRISGQIYTHFVYNPTQKGDKNNG